MVVPVGLKQEIYLCYGKNGCCQSSSCQWPISGPCEKYLQIKVLVPLGISSGMTDVCGMTLARPVDTDLGKWIRKT